METRRIPIGISDYKELIDEGFYYDFDTEKPFTDEDKEKIEQEMKKIIKED